MRLVTESDMIADGVYQDISFPEYIHWPILSQSTLKWGLESMRHLKFALDGIGREEITDAMTLGSALHVSFLEPAKAESRVVKWEGGRRYGKEWNAFVDEHRDQIILTDTQFDKLTGMIAALRENAEVSRWMKRVEAVEVSAVGPVQGVRMKARADALTNDPLWDLKKISSTDDRTILSSIWDYGYDIQAHVYREIFKRDRFCLGFVEESAPHDVRVVELNANWKRLGKARTTGLIQAMKHCQQTKHWPGRTEGIDQIEPADWMMEQGGAALDITFNGEAVL